MKIFQKIMCWWFGHDAMRRTAEGLDAYWKCRRCGKNL